MNKVTIKIDGGTITVPLGYVTEEMNLAQIEDVVGKCLATLNCRYADLLMSENIASKDAKTQAVIVRDRQVNPVLCDNLAEAIQNLRTVHDKRKAVAKKLDDVSYAMDRVRALRSEMLNLNDTMVGGILPSGAPTNIRWEDVANAADMYMMKHTEYGVAINKLNMLVIEAVSL